MDDSEKALNEIYKFAKENIDYSDHYNIHTYDFSSGVRYCLKVILSIMNKYKK